MEWVWIYFLMCKYTGDFCNRKWIGSGLILMMPRFRSCHYIRCISATPWVEMLPLHLSQLFTGISGFSCIFLPSPADTLSKARWQKSHSVFFQYLLLTLLLLLGHQMVNSFSFFQEAEPSAFILRWRLSMCFIYYLFFICWYIVLFWNKASTSPKSASAFGRPFFGSQGSSASNSLQCVWQGS